MVKLSAKQLIRELLKLISTTSCCRTNNDHDDIPSLLLLVDRIPVVDIEPKDRYICDPTWTARGNALAHSRPAVPAAEHHHHHHHRATTSRRHSDNRCSDRHANETASCRLPSQASDVPVQLSTPPATAAARLSVSDGHDYVNEVAKNSADRQTLAVARQRVVEGGFYHGAISAEQADRLLADRASGTFLVRDSSDRGRYPFSITVRLSPPPPPSAPVDTGTAAAQRRPRATTSIRVFYDSGRFRLDGVPESIGKLPNFDCVVGLIQYHVTGRGERRRRRRADGTCDAVAFVGMAATDTLLPVEFRRPLPVSSSPSSLKHLCRRRVNGLLDGRSNNRLMLSPPLKQFLLEYPYDL